MFTDADHPGPLGETLVSYKLKVVIPNTVLYFHPTNKQNRLDLEKTSQRGTFLFRLGVVNFKVVFGSVYSEKLWKCVSSRTCYVELSPYQHGFSEIQIYIFCYRAKRACGQKLYETPLFLSYFRNTSAEAVTYSFKKPLEAHRAFRFIVRPKKEVELCCFKWSKALGARS